MLAIRIGKEMEDRLDRLAKETGRTKTFYVRQAIQEHLDELEDIYLAEKSIEDIRSGKSRVYTLAEVEKELGLAN